MEASTAIEATVVIAAAFAANGKGFYPGLLIPVQASAAFFFQRGYL